MNFLIFFGLLVVTMLFFTGAEVTACSQQQCTNTCKRGGMSRSKLESGICKCDDKYTQSNCY